MNEEDETRAILEVLAAGVFYDGFVCCFCGQHIEVAGNPPGYRGVKWQEHKPDCLTVRACKVLDVPVPKFAPDSGW